MPPTGRGVFVGVAAGWVGVQVAVGIGSTVGQTGQVGMVAVGWLAYAAKVASRFALSIVSIVACTLKAAIVAG